VFELLRILALLNIFHGPACLCVIGTVTTETPRARFSNCT
jgi:hypothetical protein